MHQCVNVVLWCFVLSTLTSKRAPAHVQQCQDEDNLNLSSCGQKLLFFVPIAGYPTQAYLTKGHVTYQFGGIHRHRTSTLGPSWLMRWLTTQEAPSWNGSQQLWQQQRNKLDWDSVKMPKYFNKENIQKQMHHLIQGFNAMLYKTRGWNPNIYRIPTHDVYIGWVLILCSNSSAFPPQLTVPCSQLSIAYNDT